MSNIKLNLINHSNTSGKNDIVIFNKNEANDIESFQTAWRVIKNLQQGWNHPFVYPMTYQVNSSDSWGNHTNKNSAENGQSFKVVKVPSGDNLELDSAAASNPNQLEIRNSLPAGSINANVYKDGKLLAIKTGVAPGDKAKFEFKPTIYVGVTSQVEEGNAIDSGVMSAINTEIDLLGIKSADIVMTGGGSGKDAVAVAFSLENVVR